MFYESCNNQFMNRILIIDCYAKKDLIDAPTREKFQRYSHTRNNNVFETSSPEPMRPGLTSELEFELRQYARKNQNLLQTNFLEEMFRASDRFGTGKLLKTQVNAVYVIIHDIVW